MQLVVAEKPSVARDIARALGLRPSGSNAIIGPDRIITWCIGHLVELEEPVAYDARWKSWRMDTLPMVPDAFKLRAVPGTRAQLQVVREFLRDRRFSDVVNACDAGREGELIFRYVYEWAGSRLRVQRLWISSLTDEAIRQGFAALRPAEAYDALADAARCRSEADWLVGLNATRAVTLRFRENAARRPAESPKSQRPRPGRRGRAEQLPPVYSLGRVQTPTLAIVVRRDQEIRAFKPEDYWEVKGTFRPKGQEHAAGEARDDGHNGNGAFVAGWFIKKPGDKGPTTRFQARGLADEVVTRARRHGRAAQATGPVVERLVQRQSREPPPALFDLTSLQRTANRRFGMSASATLEVAQALYERHKVLTYPRTDSRHLSRDLAGELPRLFRGLEKHDLYAAFVAPLQARLDEAQGGSPFHGLKRIFDDTKVHDHHAIIPTGKLPAVGALGRDEERIFDLVVRRFLGAFHADAVFALTEVVVRVGSAEPVDARSQDAATASTDSALDAVPSEPGPADGPLRELPPPPDRFVARGRVRLVAGWQAVAGLDDRGPPKRGQPAPRSQDPGLDRGPNGRGQNGQGQDGEHAGRDAAPTLPALAIGQRLDGDFETSARQTRPPPRHTEATLLGAMESAGKDIEEDELRAAMKDTGLGTPATRASTIETLVKRGFVLREGKNLLASAMGVELIERLPIATLASPELTGAWEARLARIARGQDRRATFMSDIVGYVKDMTATLRSMHVGPKETAAGGAEVRALDPGPAVGRPPKSEQARVKASRADRSPTKRSPIERQTSQQPPAKQRAAVPPSAKQASALPSSARQAPSAPKPPAQRPSRRKRGLDRLSTDQASASLTCPRCRQGTLMTGHRGWGCSRWREGCEFVVWFEVAGHLLTATQLRDLIEKGKTRKITWRSVTDGIVAGRLFLDVNGSRDQGGARLQPEATST
jgi:DNA topoisomerase-3